MADLNDRVEALNARMTRSASLYIQKLRNHPQFAELLAEVEKLDGTIFETDVDQAFLRFSIQHPPQSISQPY